MVDSLELVDAAVEAMPRDALERLQEGRLMKILAHAYEARGLMRQVWKTAGVHPRNIRSLEEFKARAPFIDKDAVRRYRDWHSDPNGGLLCVKPALVRGVGSTSGTTGDPTPTPRGLRTVPEIAGFRDYWRLGVRPGDHFANVMFTYRGGSNYPVLRENGVVPIVFSHAPHEVPRIIEASKSFRPTFIRMLSGSLLHAFEREFERTGEDPTEVFKSYHGGFVGGEPLSPRMQRVVESWGLRLYDFSTFGDICGAAECSAKAGMHAHEDFGLLECLDPQGDTPVADGEVGEMVVTSLADPMTPLIRYRTDDLVIVDRSPCRCGVTHARFWPVGRKGDLIKVRGQSILPKQVLGIIAEHRPSRAALFQIIRREAEMDVLSLRVGHDPKLLTVSVQAYVCVLEESVAAAFGVPVAIELVHDDELARLGPPHKIPRVVSK